MRLADFMQASLLEEESLKLIEKLRRLAEEGGANDQMRRNVFDEECLAEQDWRDFVSAVMDSDSDLITIQKAIREWCRAETRSLRGGIASIPGDWHLFRVVSFRRLCELLVEIGMQADEESAAAFLHLHIGVRSEDSEAIWRRCPLGRFLMWSTFGENLTKILGDPPLPISSVVCALGISPEPSPYLVFQFKLQDGKIARIPTVCDAYSGSPWSRYFRTPLRTEKYGLTMPTDSCEHKSGFPEVVHGVITANELTSPMRYFWDA